MSGRTVQLELMEQDRVSLPLLAVSNIPAATISRKCYMWMRALKPNRYPENLMTSVVNGFKFCTSNKAHPKHIGVTLGIVGNNMGFNFNRSKLRRQSLGFAYTIVQFIGRQFTEKTKC